MADPMQRKRGVHHVYQMLTAKRVIWCEHRWREDLGGGRGIAVRELDCVTDDFGCLVPVLRRENERPRADALGWSYQPEASHG